MVYKRPEHNPQPDDGHRGKGWNPGEPSWGNPNNPFGQENFSEHHSPKKVQPPVAPKPPAHRQLNVFEANGIDVSQFELPPWARKRSQEPLPDRQPRLDRSRYKQRNLFEDNNFGYYNIDPSLLPSKRQEQYGHREIREYLQTPLNTPATEEPSLFRRAPEPNRPLDLDDLHRELPKHRMSTDGYEVYPEGIRMSRAERDQRQRDGTLPSGDQHLEGLALRDYLEAHPEVLGGKLDMKKLMAQAHAYKAQQAQAAAESSLKSGFPSSGVKVAATELSPGMLALGQSETVPLSVGAQPKVPEQLAQSSFSPSYRLPPDIHQQILTHQPMKSAADLEAATIQQLYNFQDAEFAHRAVESRLHEEVRRSAWLHAQLELGAASPNKDPGYDVGYFRSGKPSQTAQGRYAYDVTLGRQANAYYNYLLPQAWAKWQAQKEQARRQHEQQKAQQQGQHQAQQQAQPKAQGHPQSTPPQGAQPAGSGVVLPQLSFDKQYVVPQSASPTGTPQVQPQSTEAAPPQGIAQSTTEPNGLFDAKFAKDYYQTLYNQGKKEHNLFKLAGGSLGGGITNGYLGFTGLAEQGVRDSLDLAHQGKAEGGLSGGFKMGLGYGLSFIPSQFTQERAPTSLGMVAFTPAAEWGAATKFGQTVLANPFVQKAVLPTLGFGGAAVSGKQMGDAATGKDLLTGEKLNEEERVSRGGQGVLGVAGSFSLLEDTGKNIINGAKGIPAATEGLAQKAMGGSPELALPNGGKVNPANELELNQPMQIKGKGPGSGEYKKPKIIADLEKLPNAKLFAPNQLEHVIFGNQNRAGRFTGWHHFPSRRPGEDVRLANELSLNGLKKDEHGVYEATVEASFDGRKTWVQKTASSHTFFPDGWSREKVVNEIASAFGSGRVKAPPGKPSGFFNGVSESGVRIEGFVDANGKIVTAYPVMEKTN